MSSNSMLHLTSFNAMKRVMQLNTPARQDLADNEWKHWLGQYSSWFPPWRDFSPVREKDASQVEVEVHVLRNVMNSYLHHLISHIGNEGEFILHICSDCFDCFITNKGRLTGLGNSLKNHCSVFRICFQNLEL